MRRVTGSLAVVLLLVLGLVDAPSATAGRHEERRVASHGDVARVISGRAERSDGEVPYGYATEHRVYVGIVTNRGAFTRTPDQLAAAVDGALSEWTTTVPAGFTSFVRVGPVSFASKKAPSVAEGCGAAGGAGMFEMAGEARKLLKVPKHSTPALVTHLLLLLPAECGVNAHNGGVADLTTGWASGDGTALVPENSDQAFHNALVHELGHTLGLNHAWRGCPPGETCQRSEYGDCYSPMGSGPGSVIGTATRARSGILAPGEVYAIDGDLGPTEQDVLLPARGNTAGVRGLSILDPETGETYYLDYRTTTGLDAHRPYPFCPDGVTVTTFGGLRTTFLIPKSSVVFPPATSWQPGDVIHLGSVTVSVGAQDPATGATLHVSIPQLPAVPVVAQPRITRKVIESSWARLRIGGTFQPAPTRLVYRWYVDGQLVRDHNEDVLTARRIRVPVGDRGRLVAEVTAIVPGYHRAIVRTAPKHIAQRAIFFRPFIKGAVQEKVHVGQTVRAWFDPEWGGPPELNHVHHVCRWYANGKLIQKGSSMRLHIGPSLIGKYVVATVSVHGKGYVSETRSSNPALVLP